MCQSVKQDYFQLFIPFQGGFLIILNMLPVFLECIILSKYLVLKACQGISERDIFDNENENSKL